MPQPWSALFAVNRNPVLELNLQGLTPELADRAPAEGVNAISWLLRHILAYRRETLAVLDAPFSPAEADPRSLDGLLAALDETQAALAPAFEGVKDWSVLRTHVAVGAPLPLEQLVGIFLVHEAYHLGQVATARRLMGLPGVLKERQAPAHA
ncbi:MAG TPA: DinB family protein [Holophagaceae bacterium]|nr:DinB family protein [Holophagaceae bacterium]